MVASGTETPDGIPLETLKMEARLALDEAKRRAKAARFPSGVPVGAYPCVDPCWFVDGLSPYVRRCGA